MRHSAALLLNAVVLLAPVAAIEGLAFAREPAVWAFLALASLFVLGDLHATTVALQDEKWGQTPFFTTHALALLTGLAVLATFEVSLLTHGAPSLIGGLVMLAGVALRAWSIRALGPAFTTELVTSTRITTGPYRFARHPSEIGLLLITIGAPLLLGSLAGFAVAMLAVVPCSLARIRREEAHLREKWGQAPFLT